MRNCAWNILRGASDASTESVTVGPFAPKTKIDDNRIIARQQKSFTPQREPFSIPPPELSSRPTATPIGQHVQYISLRGRFAAATAGELRASLRPRSHPAIISDVPGRGKFITFEGLDGSGKSTQVEKLARSLRAHGLSVTITREPGGTTTGERIREVLLHSATSGLSPLTEMALMFASRAQHIHEVILPALAEGRVVLCDRFTDSTEAYQGGGRKLGSKPVLEMHEILCGNLQPDLTVLLDNEVAFSVERARRRNRKHKGTRADKNLERDENRFEQENRAFFGRVRHTYLSIAAREPQRVQVVNARGTPSETHAVIMELVRRKLKI
jgi:dTMP kinase